MEIRFVKDYKTYAAGTVISPGAGVAAEYLRAGAAEEVTRTDPREKRRAVRPKATRKRGGA